MKPSSARPSARANGWRTARNAGLAGAAGVLLAACQMTSVASPNPRIAGTTSPNALSPSLHQIEVARGSDVLENGTSAIPFYGYLGDGPLMPAAGDVPTAAHKVEATKTEPDKNTYLVLAGQIGSDPTYDYGTHFLFQGHEGAGYITRINLDADRAHRVTLIATTDDHGAPLPKFDGSTYDPWAQRLLFTAELGTSGGVWQSTVGPDATVQDISGAVGRGGYEGIQNDDHGNLIIVEDVGGGAGTVNTHDLYSYGNSFTTHWVTIHDTAVDGTTPFNANAAAKAAHATPMKRPENGVFKPGTGFTDFYFTATGDTNALTEAGSDYGGFGGVFRLHQDASDADTGALSLLYRGDQARTGFDNIAFLDGRSLFVVEDAGDGLHSQRNALDSMYLIDTTVDYGTAGAPEIVRAIAQGRDPSATIDAGFGGMVGFQNEGDNELTGIHVSDGDPSTAGVLGSKVPTLGSNGWRAFYTNQHGDNITDELFQ